MQNNLLYVHMSWNVGAIQKCTVFDGLLTSKELRVWKAFKSVCSGFLGDIWVANYKNCIKRLLRIYYEGQGVPHVPENSLSPFAPQLFPSKPHSSERRAWREVPSRYNEDRRQLPWQVEPPYDGGLLLDVQKELKCDPPMQGVGYSLKRVIFDFLLQYFVYSVILLYLFRPMTLAIPFLFALSCFKY